MQVFGFSPFQLLVFIVLVGDPLVIFFLGRLGHQYTVNTPISSEYPLQLRPILRVGDELVVKVAGSVPRSNLKIVSVEEDLNDFSGFSWEKALGITRAKKRKKKGQ
ncbi:hypothetical protein [Algoriphagus aestuariicola]